MRRLEAGDTIIEVVLAFAIFSAAAMGTITLVNSGLSVTQRNLEVTLVRQQIDTQAEQLRYLRDTGDPAWSAITNPAALVTSPLGLNESCRQASGIPLGFYIRPSIAADPTATTFTRRAITGATLVAPTTYAKIDYSAGANESQGIWIQATRAQENGSVSAYDFYIHACWDSYGSEEPVTLGTIVRIYE